MASLETFLDQTDPLERRRLELRQRREQLEFEIRRKLELEGRISVARVDTLGQLMRSLEEMSGIAKARNESMRGKLDDITNSLQAMSKDTQLKLQRSSVEHFKADYFARMKSWWPQWREEVERHKIRQVHEYETEAARAEARRRLASVTFEKERVLAETIAKRKQQLQAVQEAERREAIAREVERRRLDEDAKEMERALGDAAREEMRAAAEKALKEAHEHHRERMGRIQEDLKALMGRTREEHERRGEADAAARRRQAELLQTAEAVLREADAAVARQAASPSARDSLARDLAAARAELGDSYRADEPSVTDPDESAAGAGGRGGVGSPGVPGPSLQTARAAEERRRAGDLVDAERDRVEGAIAAKRAELLQKEREHQALLKRLRESEEREAKVRRELKERAEREARIRQEMEARRAPSLPAPPRGPTGRQRAGSVPSPDARRRPPPELRVEEFVAEGHAERAEERDRRARQEADEAERRRREAEAAAAAAAAEAEGERRRREKVEAEAERLRQAQAQQLALLQERQRKLQAQLEAEREAQRAAARQVEHERQLAAQRVEEERRRAAEQEQRRRAAEAAAAAAAEQARRMSTGPGSHQASTSTLHATHDSSEDRKGTKKVSWKFWKKGKKKGPTDPGTPRGSDAGVGEGGMGSSPQGGSPLGGSPPAAETGGGGAGGHASDSPDEDPTSERSMASSTGMLSPSGLPMGPAAARPPAHHHHQHQQQQGQGQQQGQAAAPGGPLVSATAQGLAPAELVRAAQALAAHVERAARGGEGRLLSGHANARMRDEMIRRAAAEGRADGFAIEACADAFLDCLRSFPDGVLSPEFVQRRLLAQPPGTATLADFTRSANPTAAALLLRAIDLCNALAARGALAPQASLPRLAAAVVPDRIADKRAALSKIAAYLEDCALERAQAPQPQPQPQSQPQSHASAAASQPAARAQAASPAPAPGPARLAASSFGGASGPRRASAPAFADESSGESDEDGPGAGRPGLGATATPSGAPPGRPASAAAGPLASASMRSSGGMSSVAAQILRGKSLVELEDDDELEGELAAAASTSSRRSFQKQLAVPAGGQRSTSPRGRAPSHGGDDDEFG
eukprot:tig00021221_g19351.t1